MAELFLNPWSMALAALLVAVPVIIHLINRMRFKRVRWAAMEFLLKAQKRMKRKLIFQQLLLLFLRMLLVALFGLLVGRFLGFDTLSGRETRTTAHVVILDDSPSMADAWRGDDGQNTDSFAAAVKALVEQIAPAASLATTPQTLDVIRLSDIATPRTFGRINAASIEELSKWLAGFKPTFVRGSMPDALKKAKEIAGAGGQDTAQVIHVLGDFRAADWAVDGPAVRQTADELAAVKAKVHFIDVAHPFRKDDKRPPLFHDNIGVVEFRPSKAVVARYELSEFFIRVKNFGTSELKDVRFAIAVNGDDNKGQSVSIPTLPANQEKTLKFNLTLDRVGTADKPLERFSLVTAKLETGEPGGIAADNVRHAIVEVREKLPILVVEGRPNLRGKKEGDGFYLEKMFTSVLGGFQWQYANALDLEKLNLRNYSVIFLLNVPGFSDPAAKALDTYVREGGGVGFFMGPDVRPQDYDKLYADGTGVFPVPLPAKPTDPLTDDQKLQRLFTLQKKLLLRDKATKSHPALSNIYFDERGNSLRDDEFEKFFSFVIVGQYWPVKRLGKWRDDPNTTELYCMLNEQPMGELEPVVRSIVDRIPIEEPKYAKYKDAVLPLKVAIRKTAASTEPLYTLANQLDRLLADQRTEGEPAEALVREFWTQPELGDLRKDVVRLRDTVKFGDPLYLAKNHGRGRVTLVLTTAGETWTDWQSAPGARPSFVPIITEMERYLSGGGIDDTRSCGEPIRLGFEAAAYKATLNRAFTTYDPAKASKGPAAELAVVDMKSQTMPTVGAKHELEFTETANPGAYFFTLTRLGSNAGPNEAEVPEYYAYSVNVDAKRESDLRRANRDDLVQAAPQAMMHSPEDAGWLDDLKNRKSDLSESGWLFLVMLLVLIGEQALASRLSFHSSAGPTDGSANAFRRDPAPAATV